MVGMIHLESLVEKLISTEAHLRSAPYSFEPCTSAVAFAGQYLARAHSSLRVFMCKSKELYLQNSNTLYARSFGYWKFL